MQEKNLPEDHIEALYETWQAFRGDAISSEKLDRRQAHSKRVNTGLREWFANKMGSIETVLTILENLSQAYDMFDNVGTFEMNDSPLRRVYITALTRLKQYHIQSVKSLIDGHPFPVWSMIKSMVETIGVLCQVDLKPKTAKNWVGFGEEGPIKTQKLLFAAKLLEECRRRKYTKATESIITIDKDLKHMGTIRKEMWHNINNIDHFTYQSVSLIYRNQILKDSQRMKTVEVKDGNEIIESVFALSSVLWTICAEGFNHLSLVGNKHLDLPRETLAKIIGSIQGEIK